MPDLHSLGDRLYYANRRRYSKTEGNVAYLDDAPLGRPLSMPAAQRVFTALVAVVALVLGGIFLNATVLSSLREAAAAEQAISDNLARQASIDTIPVMTDLITLSDDEVREKFADAGFTVYDASSLNANSDDMVLYKLPADMTSEDAAGMLALGIGSLDASQATKLLNGSWYFAAERSGAVSMVVRYADFSTADPQEAVQLAVEKEGFDPSSISETGVDDSGNTYNMGVVEVGKKAYTWKVSALPLDDMYSIANMPEEACYVGVRLTAQ